MLFFWNKAELFIGYSINEFNTTRDLLFEAKIESTYKITNHEGSRSVGTTRSRSGNNGINLDYVNLYTIYVHKDRLEEARKVLTKQR